MLVKGQLSPLLTLLKRIYKSGNVLRVSFEVSGKREDGDQGLTSPLAVQYKLHTFRLRGWHGLSQIRKKNNPIPKREQVLT